MNALLIALVLTCDHAAGKSCDHDHAKTAEHTKSADHKSADHKASNEESGECHHDATQAAAAPKAEATIIARGEKLKGAPAVTLDTLLASPAKYDGKTVQVEATVRRACERKGCWMELSAGDKAPGVRVTFKDYGFFVPLDSAGSTAKVEGTVKLAELSAERAKHYESEGAKVSKDKDGKYREVQLVALGVELRK